MAELLQGQLVVASFDGAGVLVDATGVQTPGVIDRVYAACAAAATWARPGAVGSRRLALWAPTARSVTVHVFHAGSGDAPALRSAPLHRASTGVWTVTGDRTWQGRYYLYDVEVYVPETDTGGAQPGHRPLQRRSVDQLRAQPARRPRQPGAASRPGGSRCGSRDWSSPEAQSVYELHQRDFSINDTTVPAPLRGTYDAFTVSSSNGMKHLRALAAAGLTTVHLLPVNDIATIDERPDQQQTPAVTSSRSRRPVSSSRSA